VSRRVLIVGVTLLAFAAGCGGDDEPDNPPPLPDLTVPRETAPPPSTATSPDTETDTSPAETTPSTSVPVTPTTPDSPENDTPPPADTPAQRFEQFCNENPGACG
jgi:hypothetical protein